MFSAAVRHPVHVVPIMPQERPDESERSCGGYSRAALPYREGRAGPQSPLGVIVMSRALTPTPTMVG